MSTIKEKIKEAIEKDYGKITSIKYKQDPQVAACWAMRVEIVDRGSLDFLATHTLPEYTAEDIAYNCIEECEFDVWPPTSGELQFF